MADRMNRRERGVSVRVTLSKDVKDRPARTPNVVFVVASHYQSLQVISPWVICSNKGNSLSFFYFCLRADYIVLSLCGAQCN